MASGRARASSAGASCLSRSRPDAAAPLQPGGSRSTRTRRRLRRSGSAGRRRPGSRRGVVDGRAGQPHQFAPPGDGKATGPVTTEVVALLGRGACFGAPFRSSISGAWRPTIRSSAAILASHSWIRSAACTSSSKAPASKLPTQLRIVSVRRSPQPCPSGCRRFSWQSFPAVGHRGCLGGLRLKQQLGGRVGARHLFCPAHLVPAARVLVRALQVGTTDMGELGSDDVVLVVEVGRFPRRSSRAPQAGLSFGGSRQASTTCFSPFTSGTVSMALVTVLPAPPSRRR